MTVDPAEMKDRRERATRRTRERRIVIMRERAERLARLNQIASDENKEAEEAERQSVALVMNEAKLVDRANPVVRAQINRSRSDFSGLASPPPRPHGSI